MFGQKEQLTHIFKILLNLWTEGAANPHFFCNYCGLSPKSRGPDLLPNRSAQKGLVSSTSAQKGSTSAQKGLVSLHV